MTQESAHLRLFSPTLHKADFYFLYGLFLLNNWSFKLKKIEVFLLDALKCEVFYIGGACQHSGFCCQKLSIFKQGNRINTPKQFEKVCNEDPVFKRFIPIPKTEPKLQFNCSCLLPNNWCSDHPNRPALCRNYPASNFIENIPFYKGCGYKVIKKELPKGIKNKRVLKAFEEVAQAFGIGHFSSEPI